VILKGKDQSTRRKTCPSALGPPQISHGLTWNQKWRLRGKTPATSHLNHGMALCAKKVKVKVKGTLVQALRHCTGLTAHRESRGIALSFHDHKRECQRHAPAALYPGKDPVPIVQEAG
jgi:hypothetical protein